MRDAVLCPARRDGPRRKVRRDLVPGHRGHFLAALAGQHQHSDNRIERAGAIGRIPDGGKLGVGQHALALGDGGKRQIEEGIDRERAAFDRPLVTGSPVGCCPARHGRLALLGDVVEHCGQPRRGPDPRRACSDAWRRRSGRLEPPPQRIARAFPQGGGLPIAREASTVRASCAALREPRAPLPCARPQGRGPSPRRQGSSSQRPAQPQARSRSTSRGECGASVRLMCIARIAPFPPPAVTRTPRPPARHQIRARLSFRSGIGARQSCAASASSVAPTQRILSGSADLMRTPTADLLRRLVSPQVSSYGINARK